MSILNVAVLPSEKYLLRKALKRTSQVMNELGSSFSSQSFILSFSKNGKSRSQIASVDTPLSLMVSHFVGNLQRCTLGLSERCPPNWSLSVKVTRARLSSTLVALIIGLTMDEIMAYACSRT